MLFKRWLKTLLSKLNYTQTVRVGKTAFKIPVIQNMGRANLKQSDTWMLDFFTSMRLTDTSGFIDIGVNVGQTLLQFRSVSAQPYWGFEPNPSCVHYLNALISANQFKSTHINSLILPTGVTIPQTKIENPTPNKILSYLIQAYETYYNTITLERVLKLLEGKKTKIVLYTYDSILLDVAKEDIKTLLPKIKQELEADGFPTRMSVGDNYGALIKK